MMSCKKTAELVSASFDRKLRFMERMSLWMHLMMCRMCGGFAKDLDGIRVIAKHSGELNSDLHLSDTARQRLQRLIDEHQG